MLKGPHSPHAGGLEVHVGLKATHVLLYGPWERTTLGGTSYDSADLDV